MSIRTPSRIGKLLALAAVLVCAGTFTGCGDFWQAITTTTTTNTGTGFDLVYAGKNSSNSFVGYSIAAGGLTAVTGSPFTIGASPLSMAITPSNAYLYIGTSNGIYGYSIEAGGGLTSLNNGTPVAQSPPSIATGNPPISMDVSPDGTWLVALTPNTGGAALIYVYQITPATGLLTSVNTATIALTNAPNATMHTIKISPNQDLVAASLGSAGTVIVPFSTLQTAASVNLVPTLAPSLTTDSENDVRFSSNSSTLFISLGGAAANVIYYPINATTGAVDTADVGSVVTGVAGISNPAALSFNFGPPSTSSTVAQSYLYAANAGDSDIIGYPITTNSTSGVISLGSALADAPYSTIASTPYALAYDNSGLYMLAFNQSGTPDLVEYTVDTSTSTAGRLYVSASTNTAIGSTLTGTLGPGITMVTTH